MRVPFVMADRFVNDDSAVYFRSIIVIGSLDVLRCGLGGSAGAKSRRGDTQPLSRTASWSAMADNATVISIS
jgi:hypothetical protein